MEDTRRKNEASMARKRMNAKAVNPASANSSQGDGTVSPSSTGAMDVLLEKLRAAAPQARDTRDRRKRARLKERHQIRVASGQEIPDIGDLTKSGNEDEEVEKSVLSPGSTKDSEGAVDRSAEMATISEGEDIADRAASMLQGLRGDGEGEPTPVRGDGSLRVRRRRESADDERRQRRRRRGAGSSSAAGDDRDSMLSPPGERSQEPIPEEPPDGESKPGTPTTVLSPPSPEGTRSRPVVVDLSD